MKFRTKLIITSALLILALLGAFLAANATVEAFHTFQKQQAMTHSRDIHAIRPWMTVPYISHVYHVPSSYLYHSLHITNKHPTHLTIQSIASSQKRPVNSVIKDIQRAIILYHQQHPLRAHPTPTKGSTRGGPAIE